MSLAQGRDIAFCATCVVALVAALCCSTASATVWTVGDARGWNVTVDYTTWASGKTFVVGDVLFFSYEQGRHDVVVVNKSEHDTCTILLSDTTFSAGNTSITLNRTGSSYYLCSFPEHCALGMKLAVNVVSAAASAPGPTSPSPSPAPVTAPTPSPASISTPTPSPASVASPTPSPSSTATPTPSPPSTSTPTPSPASSPTTAPTPSPASPTAPTSSPVSSPTTAPTPSPSTTGTTPPPPGPITPSAPPSPSSAPRVQVAIGGAVVLWTLLSSTLLML